MLGGNQQIPWWDEEDPTTTVVALCDDLRSRDESRRTATRVWDDLYDNRSAAVAAGVDPFGVLGRAGIDIASVNVTRNIVEFVHSKVTSELPGVKAESHGGDHSKQRRAVKLSRFLAGTFESARAEDRLAQMTKSGLRTGTGVLKVVVVDGRIAYEPTASRELLVDPDDARHMDPRCLYQVKPVDRHALAALYPDRADLIMSAQGSTDPMIGGLTDPWSLTAVDSSAALDVYEAWCLPRHGSPGRHVVAIRDCNLADEGWTDPRLPFVFLRPEDPRDGGGFWGQGFVERLVPLQYEINDTIASINKAERMCSLVRVFLPDSSDIPVELVEDPAVASVVPYNSQGGGPPIFLTPNGVSPQRIEWLRELVDFAYSLFGMSESAASSQRPAGINSGRAQLVYHDITTLRHVDLAKRIGRAAVDLAERTIDAARRLDEGAPGLRARFRGPAGPREIDWSEVDMDVDSYVIGLAEVSSVAETFAGHLQQLEQDVAEGRVPAESLLQIRQDPDAEAAWDQANALQDLIDWTVEELLEPGCPLPPVLEELREDGAGRLALRLRTEIFRATMSRASDVVLDRLRRYAVELGEAFPPPPPPSGPSPGAPPGTPSPSPFTGGISPTSPGSVGPG